VTVGVDPAFGPWWPLSDEAVRREAPDAPGAVQLRRADGKPVVYPRGRSAMVFYLYAARSTREALLRLFRDELLEPGTCLDRAAVRILRRRVRPRADPASRRRRRRVTHVLAGTRQR